MLRGPPMDQIAKRSFVLLPLAGLTAPDSLTRAGSGSALFLIILQRFWGSRRSQARLRAAVGIAACLIAGVHLVA